MKPIWAIGVGMCAVLAMQVPRSCKAADSLLGNFLAREQIVSRSEQIGRIDADVDGDGKKELLLAKEVPKIQAWQLYKWVAEKEVRYAGEMLFEGANFTLTSPPVILCAESFLFPVTAENPHPMTAYRVDSAGIHPATAEEFRRCTHRPPDWYDEWREKEGVTLADCSLEDLAASDDPDWHGSWGYVAKLGGLREIGVVASP